MLGRKRVVKTGKGVGNAVGGAKETRAKGRHERKKEKRG